MARPIKNNLEYFSHDNKMRNDRKIKALRAKFGLTGYAVYCMILECLCESELLTIKWDEIEIELVSGDFTIVSDELTHVIGYCIHLGLLNLANSYLYCAKLDKRAKQVFGKRIHDLNSLRIENGINIAETHISDTETPHVDTETPQRKEKKRKVNKKKEKIKENFSPCSLHEWQEYFFKYAKEYFEFPISRIKCNALSLNSWEYWEKEKWIRDKEPMKDWQRTIQNKVRKENMKLRDYSNINDNQKVARV